MSLDRVELLNIGNIPFLKADETIINLNRVKCIQEDLQKKCINFYYADSLPLTVCDTDREKDYNKIKEILKMN